MKPNKGFALMAIGITGTMLSICCMDSKYTLPAFIVSVGFMVMSLMGHQIAEYESDNKGFIKEEPMSFEDFSEDEDDHFEDWEKRDEVFDTWLKYGTMKK